MKLPITNPIISIKTAPHFIWGDHCDGWWLKKNGRFTVVSETMPMGTGEIKHFHRNTEQFFYVLEGIIDIELDGKNYQLQQHEGIVVTPGAVHKIYNQSHQDVKFLVISCPDSHEDRVNVESLG